MPATPRYGRILVRTQWHIIFMFRNLLFKKGRLSLHLLFKERMKKIRSTLNKRRALKFPVTPKCARILVKHNGRVVFYTLLLARKGRLNFHLGFRQWM